MKRFKHSLSNYRLITGDMGQLLPVGCTEVLPGDSFQQSTSALIRLSPQVAPVMHPITVRIHHFFVPNRILWDGWEDFITGGPDGLGSSDPFPTIDVPPGATGALSDYLGVPTDNTADLECSALPFRAYAKIFNEFYRDQDLVDEIDQDQNEVQHCAWEKDYFTAARPWTQKGPQVSVPIAGQAPVLFDPAGNQVAVDQSGTAKQVTGMKSAPGTGYIQDDLNTAMNFDPNGTLYADLANADAVDINEFRLAFALQRYQEARARYGSRFVEYLRYLGVRPSDARLQRPEFLGGGKATVSFSEILRTGNESGATSDTAVIGELKGHGIAALKSNRYRKFFEEHGHVISLMSVRPKTMYTQSLHKKFSRRTKEEYWQKELETIGQQEIATKEIFATGAASDNDVLGFCDRYREYREEPSIVTGEFRDLLDYWHLGRKFTAPPVLNQSLVQCEPSKRIFAEQTQNSMWIMVNNKIQARRLVSKSAASRIS